MDDVELSDVEQLEFQEAILDGEEIVIIGKDPEDDSCVIYIRGDGVLDYYFDDEDAPNLTGRSFSFVEIPF